jgi:rSAM/selenodomain-associated transferase 2
VSKRTSIIIPTFNEAERIGTTLARCVGTPETETIVVDGGSDDTTCQVASELGVQVFSTTRGRSRQMNYGASRASGDTLLFLHADTQLPTDFNEHVSRVLRNPEISAGAFSLRIEGESRSLRIIELGIRIRSRFFHLPYGDQALFLRRNTFSALDGFKEIEIMEDLELVRRLKRIGRIEVVQASVLTSARRWNQFGILKTTVINQVAIAAYLAGVSSDRIAAFYHRTRSR